MSLRLPLLNPYSIIRVVYDFKVKFRFSLNYISFSHQSSLRLDIGQRGVFLYQVLLSIFLFDWKSARIQFGLRAESYARGNTGRMSLIGLSGLYVGRFVSLSIWPLVMTCHLFISCRLLMS